MNKMKCPRCEKYVDKLETLDSGYAFEEWRKGFVVKRIIKWFWYRD